MGGGRIGAVQERHPAPADLAQSRMRTGAARRHETGRSPVTAHGSRAKPGFLHPGPTQESAAHGRLPFPSPSGRSWPEGRDEGSDHPVPGPQSSGRGAGWFLPEGDQGVRFAIFTLTTMNIPFPVKPMIGLVMVAALSGCSFIAGLFPDKQKQYRYSTDLPPLEIPPDLSSGTIEGAKVASRGDGPTPAEKDKEEERSEVAASDDTEATKPQADKRSRSPKPASTTLAQNSQDAPLIEIEESFAQAWNDVHRALGRLEVEVTDRNRSEGVFFVNYGGTGKSKKDEETGLWADIKSVFSGSDSDGQSFKVVLEEGESVTTISVRDSSDKIAGDGAGLQLLKQLNDKLKSLDEGDQGSGESDSEKSKED
ncbi:MAG: outer membrane protein assembly factor BamC [Methylococcaceae bacterium]|nr:outer membrane protein assembly factor BamC [Methylococcaceae bacterium]